MTTFFCNPWTNRGQERMGRSGTKGKPRPQATLNFQPGRPPVLDPSPSKPQNTSRTSWPGQMMSHLASFFVSPPPVYWTNPQMVRDCPPPTLPQYQGMPYPFVDSGGGLWHPAPPGGLQQQMMMNPIQMLQSCTAFPSSKMQIPVYTSNCLPPKCPTKPLNPDAKEWVPREYRNTHPATPTAPVNGYVKDKLPHHHPVHIPLIPDVCQDFCEITEKEVEEARINGQCQVPVPRWPPVTKCYQVKEVTPDWTSSIPRTDTSEGNNTSQTCLESTLAGERKVESEVQSRQSQSPLCTWENSASPVTVSEENMNESESQLCVKKSISPEQDRESCSGKNNASLTPVCFNSEINERQSPQSSSPGSSKGCARPDQDQQSADSPAKKLSLVPEVIKTEGQSLALLNQNNSSLASTTKAANSATESHRVSPVTHEKSVRGGLEVPPSPQCLGSATVSTASLSYAGVVGRASPSPPPPVESSEQQKYKGVDQPLPKIFQRDPTPPREADVPRVQAEGQALDLFRRPTKTQRTRSRKFLQELKESSQNDDDDDDDGVVRCGSSPSSNCDLSSPPSSPRGVPAVPVSPLHCTSVTPTSSPQAIPIPIPVASSHLAESPGGRTRSSSESSVASLDIDFVEQDEVDRVAVDKTPPIKGRGGLGGRNGFLACILGSGDSDSEDEDESDLDWDEVCEEDVPLALDDSWETFGFGLVVVECHVTPLPGHQTHCPSEATKPEELGGDSFLKDVNKRWEEEVRKDVRGRSAPRVTFGGEKVQRMVVWDHAYREARRGPWERQARDRDRFAKRVASLEPTLSEVLEPRHRRAVYRRLYAPPSPRCFL